MTKPLRPLSLRYAREVDDFITILEHEHGREFWRHTEPGDLLRFLIRQVADLSEAMVADSCGQTEALGFIGAVAAMMDEEKMARFDELEARGLIRRVGATSSAVTPGEPTTSITDVEHPVTG